jgi:chromosome segregation ATPase
MNDTAVITGTDLDRLAERVERAARLITELRTKATRLEEERNVLQQRLADTEGRLQGQDPGALMTEIAALRKEQRDWLAERREVTTRIEAISAKLERLE